MDIDETAIKAEARQSQTGRTLTEGQFREAWALTEVIDSTIRKSGTFREKLTDTAFAFARTEKFDAMKGETILRDIYKERYGRSMNETREALVANEEELSTRHDETILEHARNVVQWIRADETLPFYRAYDREAAMLAQGLHITEAGAKRKMMEAYRQEEGRELYDDGKAEEAKHDRPERDGEVERDRTEKPDAPHRSRVQQM